MSETLANEIARLIVEEIARQSQSPESMSLYVSDTQGLDAVVIDGEVNVLKIAEEITRWQKQRIDRLMGDAYKKATDLLRPYPPRRKQIIGA